MKNPRFLIVDDDDTFTRVLKRSLGRRGFAVDVAADVESALQLANTQHYALATIDLRMEGPSGLTLIPQLRSLQPGVRMLVLTGYASIATAVEAIKLGADNYLPKPADTDQILGALQAEPAVLSEEAASEPMSVSRLEWEHIQKVLNEHQGNISATARALGMHRRTLQRKLTKRPVQR